MLMAMKLVALVFRVARGVAAVILLVVLDELEAICAREWQRQLAAGRGSLSRFRSGLGSRLSRLRSGAQDRSQRRSSDADAVLVKNLPHVA